MNNPILGERFLSRAEVAKLSNCVNNRELDGSAYHIRRREFIKHSTGVIAGLTLGFNIGIDRVQAAAIDASPVINPFNAWLVITPDNRIAINVSKTEMGQKVGTSFAVIIAEELEADWEKVDINFKPEMPPFIHRNTQLQRLTYGSTSVSTWYAYCRELGATAKSLLMTAAANRWQVSESSLIVYQSHIYHLPSWRCISFGALVEDASQLPLPASVSLKKSNSFRYLGKSVPHKDVRRKVLGEEIYGIDMRLPNLRFAAVKQCPFVDGRVVNFDALLSYVPEGQTLVSIPNGVIVTASSWWSAQKTLDELPIEYDVDDDAASFNSNLVSQILAQGLNEEGQQLFNKGDVTAAFNNADTTLEAIYEVPFLAHAPLEPMSCTAHVTDSKCRVWMAQQGPEEAALALSHELGMAIEQIEINMLSCGGSFGRRVETDFVIQAALASKATGHPVNLLWSRPQDTQQDWFRPAFAAKMRAGITSGLLEALTGINCGQNLLQTRGNPVPFDILASEGFANLPYNIPNQNIRNNSVQLPVTIGFWRSVGHSHNAFFVESFMDEIAHQANYDPYEYRRYLLASKPRELAVLDKVAKMACWKRYHRPGYGLGMAFMEGFGSIVATVAEVSVDSESVQVHQLWCAVDCGQVIHQDGATAQIEGALIFGLSACLFGEITFREGQVEQSTYKDYPVITLKNMPTLHIQFMKNTHAPGGLGEAGTPGVAPAVVNAIFSVTGQRIRKLPLSRYLTVNKE
ncbi:xanthine dehydrogenase family protein molybdopterin-binding subunit [Marinibactrum halimedae]|uniref:Aldehyde oxidase n=1 Tax=Marinibactrum halimedae TaxID=1444977 RepID=A0AA37T8A8_9GAMM|nr:molybdopterin cofactor-binding domain-containing protein [Marinibactrum halimedae]MCD9459695.1 molybdopterin-dependent oxidoreductase [Marinibactrum halimedae]GLS25721.1 aldehyde oxidase [Marinibactrum halimedae]